MRGEDVGVATVPEPEEVANSLANVIQRARERDGGERLASTPLPTVTRQIPYDILQLASGEETGRDVIRPDIPVSRRRIACVATSLAPEPTAEPCGPERPWPDERA